MLPGVVGGCSSQLLGVGILHSFSMSCTCPIQLFFIYRVGFLFTCLSRIFALFLVVGLRYFQACKLRGATS